MQRVVIGSLVAVLASCTARPAPPASFPTRVYAVADSHDVLMDAAADEDDDRLAVVTSNGHGTALALYRLVDGTLVTAFRPPCELDLSVTFAPRVHGMITMCRVTDSGDAGGVVTTFTAYDAATAGAGARREIPGTFAPPALVAGDHAYVSSAAGSPTSIFDATTLRDAGSVDGSIDDVDPPRAVVVTRAGSGVTDLDHPSARDVRSDRFHRRRSAALSSLVGRRRRCSRGRAFRDLRRVGEPA